MMSQAIQDEINEKLHDLEHDRLHGIGGQDQIIKRLTTLAKECTTYLETEKLNLNARYYLETVRDSCTRLAYFMTIPKEEKARLDDLWRRR